MDEELQKMLDELKEKKFAKLSDKKLEHYQNLSLMYKGKNHKNDVINKISLALKGKNKSDEHKIKMSEVNKGKPHSDSHKNKISKSLSKSVLVYTYPDMNYVDEYESLKLATQTLKLNYTCAVFVTQGKRKHTLNYHLKYKEQ